MDGRDRQRERTSGLKDPLEFGTGFLDRCSREIAAVHAHWDELCDGRRFPTRRDLDPLNVPQFLSGMILVDVVSHDPLDLVYRLVGTREVDYRGFDPTGQRVKDAFYGTNSDDTMATYGAMIERGEPLYRGDPIKLDDYEHVREERLFLPFSEDGETVNMILVYITERPVQIVELSFAGSKTPER